MTDSIIARGFYFEDFIIGQSVTSPGRTITESDVVNFAGLSGDYNQLHTDAEYARDGLFGQRVAHGLLCLSVASGLASRLGILEGTVLAFLDLEWKFRQPVRIGDTVHVKATVTDKKEMPRLSGGIVQFNMELVRQDDVVAQRGVWRLLMRLKPEK